jgi:hypothetical protein
LSSHPIRTHAIPVVLVAIVLATFALSTRPARYPPVEPDSMDYMYGAVALLHGSSIVDWGAAPHVSRYTPGMALLLTPAAALGGVDATPWVPYLLALALGALAALIAGRLGGALAAPLAAAGVLFTQASLIFAGVVMADLPAAAVGLAQLALLMSTRSPLTAVGAGLLAGAAVWIRPANVVFALAGLGALTAHDHRRRFVRGYLVGLAGPLIALGVWQWITFGSPLVTSYQAAGAGRNGQVTLGGFFSPEFVLAPPQAAESEGLRGTASGPSLIRYPMQLMGIDCFLSLPGVGLVGMLAAVYFARQRGATGVLGRFTLLAMAGMLLVYLPYYWQSGRFLYPVAMLLNTNAAVLVALVAVAVGRQTRAAPVPEPIPLAG